MTRTTLNMIIQGKKLTFEAEANPGVQDDIDLLGNFESREQAIEMFEKEIKDLKKLLYGINATDNKEKKMDNIKKTLALNVILPGDLGKVGMSKEFLEATGTQRDIKLIKYDNDGNIVVYDIGLMQLAARCSQKVQLAIESYMEKEISKIKASISKPAAQPAKTYIADGKVFSPTKDGKKRAEDLILSNLKEKRTGNWGEFLGEDVKAQVIADLTQRSFSMATTKEIFLTTEKGTLFVHVPHNVYNQDRAKWSEVIETFRVACRKSRLEYSRPRDGKLPIAPRAVGKSQL